MDAVRPESGGDVRETSTDGFLLSCVCVSGMCVFSTIAFDVLRRLLNNAILDVHIGGRFALE